jgi:hypothetical protein
MEHTRIDEGVKRGPKRRLPNRNGVRRRDPLTGRSLAVIPADLLPSQVLDRYLSDEKTSVIAESYGISRSRLHQWLLEHAEEHWKKAQIARAITALEEAKEGLELAGDPLELARAREQLRSAQWELERIFSRIYGQKQEVTLNVSADLGERLRRAQERVIEHGEAAALPQSSAANEGEVISPNVNSVESST